MKRRGTQPALDRLFMFLRARGRELAVGRTDENNLNANNNNNRKRSAQTQKSNSNGNSNAKRSKMNHSNTHKTDKSIQLDQCPVCNDGSQHYVLSCKKFNALDLKQRQNMVRQHKSCWNCFSSQHTVSDCKSRNCKQCDGKHHTGSAKERVQCSK